MFRLTEQTSDEKNIFNFNCPILVGKKQYLYKFKGGGLKKTQGYRST